LALLLHLLKSEFPKLHDLAFFPLLAMFRLKTRQHVTAAYPDVLDVLHDNIRPVYALPIVGSVVKSTGAEHENGQKRQQKRPLWETHRLFPVVIHFCSLVHCQLFFTPPRSLEAAIKSLKRGLAAVGLDLNSGWNCTPRPHR
jgi:hypothetical protein